MMITVHPSVWRIEDPETKKQYRLMLMFEDDGTLVIAETSQETPQILHRQQLSTFPSDKVVQDIIAEVLHISQPRVVPINPHVELDDSALQGLKKMPVDIFNNDYLDEMKPRALVLCTDLRNFSRFLRDYEESRVFKLIKEFTSNFLSCVNQFGYGCSYYKLLGDGALIIWDETTEDTIREALMVFDTYVEFLETDLFCEHPQLGLGGSLVSETLYKYEISAEASQLKYRDYVGYGINLACRIQALAEKNQLVINKSLAQSGLIPYTEITHPAILEELRRLKGLKEEDQEILYCYRKE
ncbi:MAG: hypothetical protein N2509_00945 [Treponemataceae bacterium]|nr:hypothetical protein [Treponemataceae bacterium]HOJ99907.1 hypothetical protein [Termitinemataceae bacterium]HOM24137.1 hypothetical protein [Termitinemataceae bacterium]HPQ01204.1 hypothetical protein [Termitinemataceae bacterium]